ncbi:MAG: riboflavin synthase [Candidatus Eutrophobiaceae bacterium]
MFSGIIETIGIVERIENTDAQQRMLVFTECFNSIPLGASIAINGACLTASAIEDTHRWWVYISAETLSCTALGELSAGAHVNLERSLCVGDRLDGHFVSGHVDAPAEIISITPRGQSRQFRLHAPQRLMSYITPKGSVCIDGVSLTVNAVADDAFVVDVIPHTLQTTLFGSYAVGKRVNIEIDLIARYTGKLMKK